MTRAAVPSCSVVIPAYHGGDLLVEAVGSVLAQTRTDWELIVVDDASPEPVAPIVDAVADARVRCIRHPTNRGAVAARQTGSRAAAAGVIAYLDEDDLFHVEKLAAHLEFLARHPGIGMTCNDRFEIRGSDRAPCGLHRAPSVLRLEDWVTGYPVSPSDVVLRREWALRDEIWEDSGVRHDGRPVFNGQEIVFGGRLALAGCGIGHVGRALNCRRHHPGRTLSHLDARCRAELACQALVLSDPRCPASVSALRPRASAGFYVMWAYTAYLQGELDLARSWLAQAAALDPASVEGDPCPLVVTWTFWGAASTADVSRDPDAVLRTVFDHLPPALARLASQRDWAAAHVHLARGLRTLIWGRAAEAEAALATALARGARLDEAMLDMVSEELLNYESELGAEAASAVLRRLADLAGRLDFRAEAKRVAGFCAHNRAFRNFRRGRFEQVPSDVAQAVSADYRYLLNRGIVSVLVRSLLARGRGVTRAAG